MIGGDNDERVGPAGRECFSHAAELGVEGIANAWLGQVSAARDPGRVTADTCKDQAHTPATFSSVDVVIA